MNRHERRASVKSIRHSDLLTHLIAVEVPLDDHAILHRAVLHFYATIASRKPVCIGCKASFFDEETCVGSFLLAQPIGTPDMVVSSAFCAQCHETLSIAEVDAVSARVLSQIVPNGRFLA